MKNLKIGKKLLVIFTIILILFCATVVVSFSSLNKTAAHFTTFYNGPYEITNKASDMRTALQSTIKNFGYAIMTRDKNKTAEYIQASKDNLQEVREDTVYLREHFGGDISLIDNYDNAMKSVMDKREQVYEFASANRNEEAADLWFNEVNPAFLTAMDYLSQINDAANAAAADTYHSAVSQRNITTIVLLLSSVVTLAGTIALALYITGSLIKPIKEIETATKEIVQGNLQAAVTYQSRDELGGLSDSMRLLIESMRNMIQDIQYIMSGLAAGNFEVSSQDFGYYQGDYFAIVTAMHDLRDKMNGTLLQINMTAEQVSAGSEQVSDGAQALSQGATEQASSVEELAATINEISIQIKGMAQEAQIAKQEDEKADIGLQECNQQMRELVSAMETITNKSSEIGKIIKTIEDIAFQTNILALNAAVEAARAGSAGKGFAVVADEVRNLASKSSDAAKSTTVLIEETVKAVDQGYILSSRTDESLEKVVKNAKRVLEALIGISDTSANQAQSIAQVTQGIEQISSVVQTNSATAEESAAASEELSGQAQILKDLVEQFKLRVVEA